MIDTTGAAASDTPALSPCDRRHSERIQCAPDGHLTAQLGYDGWPAQVRDLSLAGISLVLSHPLVEGTCLPVRLRGQTTLVIRLLHVLRVTPLGPACWVAGGRFDRPLTSDELQGLLR